MAFADPQSITIAPNPALSLPRVSSGVDNSKYSAADATVTLFPSHQYGKRNRRLLRLTHNKVATDPISAENAAVSMTMALTADIPVWGYSIAELQAIYNGFTGQIEASSSAVLLKWLGGES